MTPLPPGESPRPRLPLIVWGPVLCIVVTFTARSIMHEISAADSRQRMQRMQRMQHPYPPPVTLVVPKPQP